MQADLVWILVGIFVASMLFSGERFVQWIGIVSAVAMYLFSCAPAYAQQKTYTNSIGEVMGYSYRQGNQTTYTDAIGRVQGYRTDQGRTSTYTNSIGQVEGYRTNSNGWDKTDRYGVDPALRGSRNDD